MSVASDNQISAAGDGAFKNPVVRFVRQYCDAIARRNVLGQFAQEECDARQLVAVERELPAQYPEDFAHQWFRHQHDDLS